MSEKGDRIEAAFEAWRVANTQRRSGPAGTWDCGPAFDPSAAFDAGARWAVAEAAKTVRECADIADETAGSGVVVDIWLATAHAIESLGAAAAAEGRGKAT